MSNIIALTPVDVDAVTACYNAANGHFSPENRPNATRDDFLEIFRQDTLLGWQENGLMGFVSYGIQAGVLHVNALYVDIPSGRRGIGAALMDAAIDAAQGQGAQLCIVDCLKSAPWALSFYHKLGFLAYSAGDCPVDNAHALAYFKAHEEHTWSVRLYKLL